MTQCHPVRLKWKKHNFRQAKVIAECEAPANKSVLRHVSLKSANYHLLAFIKGSHNKVWGYEMDHLNGWNGLRSAPRQNRSSVQSDRTNRCTALFRRHIQRK